MSRSISEEWAVNAIESGRAAAYIYAARFLDDQEPGGPVTSEQISAVVGVNATQVRRDLSKLIGRGGKRGYGYNPDRLIALIREGALAAERPLMGAGGRLITEAARETPGGIRTPLDTEQALRTITLSIATGARIAAEIDFLIGRL